MYVTDCEFLHELFLFLIIYSPIKLVQTLTRPEYDCADVFLGDLKRSLPIVCRSPQS